MPEKGEETAIEDAFQEQVRSLYRVLVSNLIDGGSDEKPIEAFSAGLKIARRAKELASSASKASPAKRPARSKHRLAPSDTRRRA